MSFGVFRASKTWIKSQLIEIDSASTSSEDHCKSLRRQNAFDFDSRSSNSSGACDSFGYAKYIPVSEITCDVEKTKSGNKLNLCKEHSSKSGESSFDVPLIPITHRACEDLSALKIIEAVPVDQTSSRKSLPSLLRCNQRYSTETSVFERSASLDLINFYNFSMNSENSELNVNTSKLCHKSSSEKSNYVSSIRFSTSYVSAFTENCDDSVQKSLRRVASNPNFPNYLNQCNHSTQGLSSYCYRCYYDALSSPRSSDSGLADITGTSTIILQNIAQDCGQWNSRSSLYDQWNNLSLSETPISTDEFESQCICTSPFESTSKTIIQTPSTSKIVHHKSPTNSSDPTPADCRTIFSTPISFNEEQLGPGVYRSGMYAHWWLKTRLPAEKLGEENNNLERINKGKKDVSINGTCIFTQLAVYALCLRGVLYFFVTNFFKNF